MDIILMIALSLLISKKFSQRGKMGAGKYVLGIVGIMLFFEVIAAVMLFNDINIGIILAIIVLGYAGAIIVYNIGKKEAESMDQNMNSYYGVQQPVYSPYGYTSPQVVCKAYNNGLCAPYGNNRGYNCDYNPQEWQNCPVVKSNIEAYGKW